MLFYAALSDPGPFGKRTRELMAEIERYLAGPTRKGRVIAIPTIAKGIGAKPSEIEYLKIFVAQAWLQQNLDPPAAAAGHYKNLLETELGKLDPDVRLLISRTLEKMPRQAFASKKTARTILTKVTAPMTAEFVAAYEKREDQTSVVKATALEAAICKVRDAYITAAIGEMPAIPELMEQLGFMRDGAMLAAAPAGLSEAAVRERQLAEDWRGQRAKHVVRAFDIVPEEVKLIAIVRAVEANRMLFTHLQALSRIYSNYYKTGQMLPLLHGTQPGLPHLKLRPDPSVLASIAETMNRMVGGSGEKLSITINQTTSAQQAVQAEGAKADVQISQATKEYLAKLGTMTDSEIERELANMDQVRLLLANAGVTGEAASSQTVDAEAREIPVAKPPAP